MVDLSDDEFDDVINELENALVLEPWGTDGWRFRHELLREVAAELAPPSVRRGLHAKVADALVEGGGEPDWRLVAGHYEQAERFQDAASAYQQASTAARQRGALAEAAPYLALPSPSSTAPRPARTATAARWPAVGAGIPCRRRGRLPSRCRRRDFERCLQLGGTDLRDDEVFATLLALAGYYATRADLRRMAQVLESLRAGVERGRQWFGPMIEVPFGVVAWLRGEFAAARSHLERATAGLAAADRDRDRRGVVHAQRPDRDGDIHLALVASCAAISPAPRPSWRTRHTGPNNSASRRVRTASFTRSGRRAGCRIEAGQLDRAAVLAADDDRVWPSGTASTAGGGSGPSSRPAVGGLAALGADDLDPTALCGPSRP